MELLAKTYNNQKTLEEWDVGNKEKSAKKGENPKLIALLLKFEETLSGRNNSNSGSSSNNKNPMAERRREAGSSRTQKT
eukprot:1514610-Ditylum_brightwellii.AAC.1